LFYFLFDKSKSKELLFQGERVKI